MAGSATLMTLPSRNDTKEARIAIHSTSLCVRADGRELILQATPAPAVAGLTYGRTFSPSLWRQTTPSAAFTYSAYPGGTGVYFYVWSLSRRCPIVGAPITFDRRSSASEVHDGNHLVWFSWKTAHRQSSVTTRPIRDAKLSRTDGGPCTLYRPG